MTDHSATSIAAKGVVIPQIGLGTWELGGQVLADAVDAAVAAGYRHFDTAPRYGNEAELGAALRATGLARDSLFITTKVWYTELSAPALRRSAETSVERLGLGPVDLLLVHWPSPDVPLEETMAALREVRLGGLTRHIGVSNFPISLLDRAVALTEGELVANQCEYHPRLDQVALIRRCRHHGLAFIAYAPVGNGRLLQDPVIAALARRHDRSPAQIILRWHVQQGVAAIPRSTNPRHIAENIAVTGFALDEAEMAAISGLAVPDGRIFDPAWVTGWA